MKIYLHELNPIDFGWELLPTLPELKAIIAQRWVKEHTLFDIEIFKKHEERLKYILEYTLQLKLWGEPIRTEPRIMVLPPSDNSGCDFNIAYAWKQDNNGSTYIVSPIPLDIIDVEVTEINIPDNPADDPVTF